MEGRFGCRIIPSTTLDIVLDRCGGKWLGE